MSVSITFRASDELAAKLELRCSMRKQSKTEVLSEAIERGWDAPGMSGEPVNPAPYRPPATTKAALLASIPGLKTAATLGDEPGVPLGDVEPETLKPAHQCTNRDQDARGDWYRCKLPKSHKGKHIPSDVVEDR